MSEVSNVGVAIAVVAATPATTDASGFAALTWTATVGFVTMWGETGDASENIAIPYLSGRTLHVNGGVDGGAVPFSYTYNNTDAGQVILRNNNNGQTTVSVRETHTDGRVNYYFGKVANVKTVEKSSKSNKAQTGEIRVNSVVINV